MPKLSLTSRHTAKYCPGLQSGRSQPVIGPSPLDDCVSIAMLLFAFYSLFTSGRLIRCLVKNAEELILHRLF